MAQTPEAGRLTCRHCGGPVWTLYLAGNFIGSTSLLYAHAKLAGIQPRYRTPNVQGCDACRLAWPLSKGVDHGQPVVSRRRFLFLGAAAGITLAAAPLLDLLPPFTPAWPLNRHLYGRVQLTQVQICAGRRAGKSAFVAAWRAETEALIRDIYDRENLALLDGRRLQVFPLTTRLSPPYPQQSMGLHDEEQRIEAADWGGDSPFSTPVDEKLWRAQTMGSFETPQQPPVLRERRRPGEWRGPGRRATDVDLGRFADDGGPA